MNPDAAAFTAPQGHGAGQHQHGGAQHAHDEPHPAVYVCPMHPEETAGAPGKCSRCGMALVPVDSHASKEYRLDISTQPARIVPGKPFELKLSVRDEKTSKAVTDFTVVHERPFHLFIVREDLGHYQHVHPEKGPNGAWTIDVVLPEDGAYKIFADVLPRGGQPQVLVAPIVAGTPPAHYPPLVPDRVLKKTVDSMAVELALPDGGLTSGREQTLTYRLTDAATGRPVTDLEPYLGAWGHTLIMSEGSHHFVHAHPVESLAKKGGSTLTFHANLPHPGTYRVWTQFKRNGEISTAMFTIAAAEANHP